MVAEHAVLELQQNIEKLVDALILTRLQLEELEEENAQLKAEQQRWRHDLSAFIDQITT